MNENRTFRARFLIHTLRQKAFGKVRPPTTLNGETTRL